MPKEEARKLVGGSKANRELGSAAEARGMPMVVAEWARLEGMTMLDELVGGAGRRKAPAEEVETMGVKDIGNSELGGGKWSPRIHGLTVPVLDLSGQEK